MSETDASALESQLAALEPFIALAESLPASAPERLAAEECIRQAGALADRAFWVARMGDRARSEETARQGLTLLAAALPRLEDDLRHRIAVG